MKKKVFTRPVTVVLSESMYQQIENITNRLEIGLSDWIRNAISMKLEKQGEQVVSQQDQSKLNNKTTEDEYHADN